MTAPTVEERLEALEAKVATLSAERELRELLSRYSFTADLGLGDDWVALWTDDGVYDIGTGNTGTYQGSFDGAARLHDLITGDGMPPTLKSQHHTLGPLVFEIDGDVAFAEGYSVTFVERPDGIETWNLGFSHWSFRHEDGRWKIHHRYRREASNAEITIAVGTAARGENLRTGGPA